MTTMIPSSFQKKIVRFSKNIAKILWSAFIPFSMMVTILDGLGHFLPRIDDYIKETYALVFVLIVSIVYGLFKNHKSSKIRIKLPHTETTIEILFGDLFKAENGEVIAISANEFFDSKIGKPVSEKSLHGLLIKKYFKNNLDDLDEQIKSQLSKISGEEILEKTEGKTKKFPIGSGVIISSNQKKFILFALSKTEPETCKAYSNPALMLNALHGLWNKARIEVNGYPLRIPLIGGGLSGIDLPSCYLLNLIMLSLIAETKNRQITSVIRIVLHPDLSNSINLKEIKNYWEK